MFTIYEKAIRNLNGLWENRVLDRDAQLEARRYQMSHKFRESVIMSLLTLTPQ